jgi:hypothetical protein
MTNMISFLETVATIRAVQDGIYVCLFDGPITVVGPFKDESEAVAFGHGWNVGAGDDPRWNTVEIRAGKPLVEIRTPTRDA